MSLVMDFTKKGYRALRRAVGIGVPAAPVDDFPIDAWTDPSYEAWFKRQAVSADGIKSQIEQSKEFPYQPKFSFIVPLYKTPLDYLHVMADSVLSQTYSNLELVLVNASPENEALAKEVEQYCARDSRVIHVPLDDNYGITENTNEGLAVATGDFCCFLDHDDFIEPNCLYEYVAALNDDKTIDVLYCDEDIVALSEEGPRFQNPLFKTAYSPELLLCKNYIFHFMAIRRELILAMPRPSKEFDGSQDFNMVAWCAEHARRVCNIEKVLYHWCMSSTSTALEPDSKPYVRVACRKTIEGELSRRNIAGSIMSSDIAGIHTIWFAQSAGKSLSVIVDCTDRAQGWVNDRPVERFIDYFFQNRMKQDIELILINAGENIQEREGVCIKQISVEVQKTSQFTCFNQAASISSQEYLLFLDAGCSFLSAEPLIQLVEMCSCEGIGVSSPKVLYRNGINKSYGVAMTPERIMPLYRGYDDTFPGYQCNLRAFQNSSACGIQGLCTRKSLFNSLGGFDESFKGEIGAADYCKRVRDAGYRMAQMCTVKLEVDEPCPQPRYDCATNAMDYSEVDLIRFDRKWPGFRDKGDSCLNRNLNQGSSYFQI